MEQVLDPNDAPGTEPRGSLEGEWKAPELGLSPAARSLPSTFPFTSGNGHCLTELLLVPFSGPPSEVKEEVNELRSRVEALEQVKPAARTLPAVSSLPRCSSRPLSARSLPGLLQLGFPSILALFITSHWAQMLRDPHWAPAVPAPQPFERNQSP